MTGSGLREWRPASLLMFCLQKLVHSPATAEAVHEKMTPFSSSVFHEWT